MYIFLSEFSSGSQGAVRTNYAFQMGGKKMPCLTMRNILPFDFHSFDFYYKNAMIFEYTYLHSLHQNTSDFVTSVTA